MANRDLVAEVFVDEWARLRSSPAMRRALRRWRADSNGLITATSCDELLAVIKNRCDVTTSTEVATWLLATADPLATRILVQAMQPVVMISIRRSELTGYDVAEYANSCVTSLFLVTLSLAGTQTKWVIWSIRRAYFAEMGIRSRRLSTKPRRSPGRPIMLSLDEGRELSGQRNDTPARSADVELGRLLLEAVNAGKIDIGDAQLLWLHTVGGVSYAELSAIWGIPIPTIRKHQTRLINRVGRYTKSSAA